MTGKINKILKKLKREFDNFIENEKYASKTIVGVPVIWDEVEKAIKLTAKNMIKDIKKISDTTHSCKNKRCRCYNEEREDQNCWVIDKEDLEDLKKKYED